MIVNSDVDVYILLAKETREHSEKRIKKLPENQMNIKYQNAS